VSGPSAPQPSPQASIGAEVKAVLEDDGTRLGDVYRLLNEGLKPAQIAENLGTPTFTFVYTYRQQIDALVDGKIPRSTGIAGQTASRVRKWLRRSDWSEAAQSYLVNLLAELEAVAEDAQLAEREDTDAAQKTKEAEGQNVPGVYVYALPHYLRYPYDPQSGHTLFKVGHSSVDVFSRVDGQRRTTALPEDPVLLRIYATEERPSKEEEDRFHAWLEAADHRRSRSSRAGREWFLTSTKFLDHIADQRGLPITVVSTLDVGAEVDDQ
jgi:hypothetical protein